jgi:hypothetical protein
VLPLICSNHWANHDTSAASCNKSLLCATCPVLLPHSCAITRRHVGQWLSSSPCSPHACRMDAESLPEHLYRLVPGHARSSQRASHHITSPPAISSTPTRPHLHHPRSTTTHRIESTPHAGLLNRSLARAGCNPEFCRPRTPSPKVHSLLLVTEVLLSSPLKPSKTAICRSLAELRNNESCAWSHDQGRDPRRYREPLAYLAN